MAGPRPLCFDTQGASLRVVAKLALAPHPFPSLPTYLPFFRPPPPLRLPAWVIYGQVILGSVFWDPKSALPRVALTMQDLKVSVTRWVGGKSQGQ
jgi:hypothetical protein